jgi:hypothetical protein
LWELLAPPPPPIAGVVFALYEYFSGIRIQTALIINSQREKALKKVIPVSIPDITFTKTAITLNSKALGVKRTKQLDRAIVHNGTRLPKTKLGTKLS